jgi:L-cysteine/cystine lyase
MYADTVARARAELPVTGKNLYFNTGWSGPSPRRVVEEQKRVLDWLAEEGVSHHIYEQLNKDIEELRSRLARYLGAVPAEIALTRNTTEALNIVLEGIDWRPSQKIVTTNVEHGAGLVPVYVLRDRYGLDVQIVDISDGRNILSRFARAIDDDTRLVSVSHVSFNTGLRLPLKELAELTADHGAELLVDGAQSVGVFRIDLHDIGCDYYAFPGHKWMLGPDSTGALYVRKDKLPKLAISFAGNETAKKFDREGRATYHTDAKKFQMCDFNPALISGWVKALDFIAELGPTNIEDAIKKNTKYLKERLARLGRVRMITSREWKKSAGLIAVEMEGKKSKAVFNALLRRGIVVRYTPDPSYVRLSVNYFNTLEELDRLVEALESISAS